MNSEDKDIADFVIVERVEKATLSRDTTLESIESEETSVIDFNECFESTRKGKNIGPEITLSLDKVRHENRQRRKYQLASDDTTSSISDTESFSTLPDNEVNEYQDCPNLSEVDHSLSDICDMSTPKQESDHQRASLAQEKGQEESFVDEFCDGIKTVTDVYQNDSISRGISGDEDGSGSFTSKTLPNFKFRKESKLAPKGIPQNIPVLNKNIKECDLLRHLKEKTENAKEAKRNLHKKDDKVIKPQSSQSNRLHHRRKFLSRTDLKGYSGTERRLSEETDMDIEIPEDDQTIDKGGCYTGSTSPPLPQNVRTTSTTNNLAQSRESEFESSIFDTCIIFDWDDTLFPSSYVEREGFHGVSSFDELPRESQSQFIDLERQIMTLLKKASEYGHVLIITNAQNGWVEFCCKRFLPNLMYFFEYGPQYENYLELAAERGRNVAKYTALKNSFVDGRPWSPNRMYQNEFLRHFVSTNDVLNYFSEIPPFMKVVSARANFEALFPRDTICWKAAAFAHELHYIQRINKVVLRNILSFGDSLDEQTAVKINANQLGSKSKSVKFLDNPSHSQLFRQLEVMVDYVPWISNSQQDLDVLLTVQNESPNPDEEAYANVTNPNIGNGPNSFSDDQMTLIGE